ncbi:anthranilate phosphoribosyltransferase [Clostridium sp. PL3]|uniref:Anthranilate phosphoribosyltransferase n=1 Tax=Clostridium thailandense TaxID=2794346 RepID=A0A949TUC6_9CLOT|nr:anthranilate phosphoribosyltransferase [Clostridium thailandense]MBV7273611.1 anthranilate phosphoribosyltransferase [Clostridium thailandense]
MLKEAIKKVAIKESLTEKEAYSVMNEIMEGKGTNSQIGAFLMGLRMKGEKVEEITGFAKAIRDNAVPLKLKADYVIDTCGTGGDGGKTFNISTVASIIAAAAGVKIAKHGNRAVSSKSGSADVLEELGFNINLQPEEAKKCIDEKGMAFLFAQKYHSAMKNAAMPRKELGIRTVFNVLGPLTNPSFVKGQMLGVYDKKLTNPIAQVLLNLGCERAMVVSGGDGLDEITTTTITHVSELKEGKIIDYTINPEDFEIKLASIEDIKGGSAEENRKIILEVLKGSKGPKRNIVVLNSAAALYVGKVSESIKAGVKLAGELIDSGAAYNKLKELVEYSKSLSN